MDRLARVVVASLLIGVGGFALIGAVPVGPLVLAVPLGAAALWVLLFRHAGAGPEVGWAGRAPVLRAPAPTALPSAPPLGVDVGPRPPSTRRQVAAALGRAEAREWLSSPWFAVGVGFCVLLTVLFGWVFGDDSDGAGRSWHGWFVLFPIMAHPMVGTAVVGAHHAVTRGRHDGVEELFGACPADEQVRTAGHLRCAWIPAAALALFVVVATLVFASHSDRMYGPVDSRAVGHVLAAIVLGACGVGLGVALGRWAPWRLVPLVAVAALVPVITTLGGLGEPHWSNLRQLSTWPRFPDHDLLFTDPPVWWHLAWLAALGGLTAFVALAHARLSRRVALVGAGLALLAVLAGVAQTRPITDGAERLASLVAEPERHQTCRTATGIELCVYRGYEGYLDQALAHAAPVAAAAPDAVAPVVFRQAFDGDPEVLGPEVNRAIARLEPDAASHLALGYETSDAAMTALRLVTAFDTVGLPTRAEPDGVPVVIAGEARGVLALWLAARGLDPSEAERLASHHYNPDDDTPDRTPDALDLGMAWPEPCGAGPPPVAWSAQDLVAARALIALPQDDVHALVLRQWETFTDPATTTDALLLAAGLEPVGAPDRVVAVPTTCDW